MLAKQIDTFNENINGLRDFIELIGPFIEEHHKRAIDEHNKITEAFDWARQLHEETDEINRVCLEEKIRQVFDGELVKVITVDEEDAGEPKNISDKEAGKPRTFVAVPVSKNSIVDSALKAPRRTTYQKELLYKNAFIGLLSSVEWFYSQVLHFYYDRHPDAAGVKKKTMTLEDLKTFSSVEDAEKYLIDNKIEEIFRGGFDGWVSILKEEIKLKMPYMSHFYNDLVEIYQRRNLLVHNGGMVNSIYLSKIPQALRGNLKIGKKLSIKEDYLENSICKLHTVFTLVAAELWKKLDPNEESRADILNSIAFHNMKQSRWEVSEWLSGFIKDDENLKSRVKTVGQLNYWLSKKRRGQGVVVKAEIAKADFTDKSLRYQLAISALEENKVEFFELLPEALRTKSLEVEELIDFPIFEEMRETTEFMEFKNKSPEFKELVKINDQQADITQESNDTVTESESISEGNNPSLNIENSPKFADDTLEAA